jgi:EAL domain-containing protein (putative c-di-GMP-specific phosphodiesterase class I)
MIKGIARQNKAANIKTVAEFIETKEQAEILRDLGVDYGQGWYFSRAKPAIEFNNIS